MSDLFRSKEITDKYSEHKRSGKMNDSCALCQAPSLREFKYWRVINNEFPYDLIASVHQMIVPNRHVTEDELMIGESEELKSIKISEELKNFDYFIEANTHKKSIPEHFHIHIIVGIDLRSKN